MRSANAIIIAMLAIALLVAVPFASEEGDADIAVLGSGNVVITGDIVLEEDARIESGTEVLINNGASIDISNYSLVIGQGAKIVIVGSASITSSGGSVILEGGEPFEFGTVVLPAFEDDVKITFNGTISLELRILSGTLSIAFEPFGFDKSVHVERGGTKLTLVEPSIVFKLGLGTVDVVVGFSEMTLFTEKHDGNTLLSTNTTTIVSRDKKDSLDLALYLKSGEHGHLYLKDINIVSVEISTYYEESGITNNTKLSGFDRLGTSLEDDGILAVSSHIDTIVTERYLLDVLQSKDTFEDIGWVIAVDLPVLFQVLYAEMTDGTKPDASELIETIDITVGTGTLENHVRDTVRHLSDISIVLSRTSSQHILEIRWQDDDASYRIISSNLVLNSFGLSSSFMMDLDVSVPLIKAEIRPFSGPASDIVVTDMELGISNMDLPGLYIIYSRLGTIDVQQLLDNCERFHLFASSITYAKSGHEMVVRGLDAVLEEDVRRMNTLGLSVDSVEGSMVLSNGGILEADVEATSVCFSTDGSLAEYLEIMNSVPEITTNSEMTLKVNTDGADIDYAGPDRSLTVSIEEISSGASGMELDLAVRHTLYKDSTLLNGCVSASGYKHTLKEHDYGKKMCLDAVLTDAEVSIDGLDVGKLAEIYHSDGKIGATEIADNTDRIAVKVGSAVADYGDIHAEFEFMDLRIESSGRYMVTISSGSMAADIPVEGSVVDLEADSVDLLLSSDVPFTELQKVSVNGFEFESDASIDFTVKLTGLNVKYSGEGPSVIASGNGTAEAKISFDNSMRWNRSVLSASLSAEGYGVSAKGIDKDGKVFDVTVVDPEVDIDDIDVAALLSAYDRDGTVSIGMLDHCKSIGASATYLAVKMDEGEKLTLVMINPELDVGADKKSTVHVDSSTIDVVAPVQDGELELEAAGLVTDISSTTTFSELIEIINNRLEFDSDADISIETTMSDASITYTSETISFSLTETDDAGSPELFLNASLVHTEETSETLLGVDTSTAGYTLELDSHGLHNGKVPVEGDDLHVMSVNPGLTVGDLQIVELLDIYDKKKSLKPQEFLDRCGSFVLSTAHAEVEWDGDGEMDAFVDNASAGLSRDSSGNATVTFEMEEAKVAVPIHEMTVDLHANETKMTLSSDISFSELIELIFDGMEFTEDTNMAITFGSKGLDLGLDKDGSTYHLSLVPREESLSNPFKLDLDLNYILYNDKSTLSGKLDTSGYTTTVMADMDEATSKKVLSLPFSTDVGTSLKFVMEDLVIDMSGFDIKTVYDIIAETKTISVQQLIDSSNSLGMSVASISADIDSDDAYDATLSNVRASLSKSILGQNTTSFGFEDLVTTIELEKGTVDVHSGASEAVIITEGSITECIDAFLYGVDFSTETRAEIHLSNESLLVEYKNGENYLSIVNEKMFATSPQYVTMVLSMEYSDYKDTTSLSGRLSSIGHSIVLYNNSVVNDDGGIVYLTLEIDEVSGGFEVDYAEDVSLSANLYMPWKIDFSYYDVEFKIESSDSLTSLTHGTLDVDGYDQKEEGLLAILPAIKDSDFTYETRALLSSGDMSVYGNDGTTVLSSYGNTEIGIKKALVDLKRGDVLNVALEKLDLSITDQDGKVTEKSLDRLDVTKDVSGAMPEEGWVEKNSLLLAIVFLAAATVMIGYMVRYHMKKSKDSDPEDSELKE